MLLKAQPTSSESVQGAIFTMIQGEVFLIRASGESLRVQPSMVYSKDGVVYAGDVVTTGSGASAQMELDDGSRILLSENARFQIKQVQVVKSEGFLNLDGFLSAGNLMLQVEKLSSDSMARVTTPTAVAAVRGTRFAITQEGDSTDLLVDEGAVAMMAAQNVEVDEISQFPESEEEPVVVEAGHGVEVKSARMILREARAEERKKLKDAIFQMRRISLEGRRQMLAIREVQARNRELFRKTLEWKKRVSRKRLEHFRNRARREMRQFRQDNRRNHRRQ